MISIVIRNKNEAASLENTLSILKKVYNNDFAEIIIVDNYSTDDSVKIAEKFNCRVVYIKEFTYGKATNLGIETARSEYVLLLSSHAIPIGSSFFRNSINALSTIKDVAGIRYITNLENYQRAIKNDFIVKEPFQYGLMTACALINKKVWEQFKFNEELPASEDKEWSQRVYNNGFKILDLNETFFYFIKRNQESSLKRYKNETTSEYILSKRKFSSVLRIFLMFLKKIIFTNSKAYFNGLWYDFLILKTKLQIRKELNKAGSVK